MKKEIRLKFQGEEFTVNAERSGDTIEIERDGAVFTVQVMPDPNAAVAPVRRAAPGPVAAARAGSPAPSAGVGGESVIAPMTGTIKQVMVGSGDSVKEGDHVMMMEAMKMDMEISAPRAGTVGQILCKVGDGVKENQPLLTIE